MKNLERLYRLSMEGDPDAEELLRRELQRRAVEKRGEKISHMDAYGQPIHLGDFVVYGRTRGIPGIGVVIRESKKMIRVNSTYKSPYEGLTILEASINPQTCIALSPRTVDDREWGGMIEKYRDKIFFQDGRG